MERELAASIAAKMQEAMRKIEEAIDEIREIPELKERAPLLRAIGESFATTSDEIYSRLVKANPDLHEVLFRGLPRNAPDDLLRMSQCGRSTNKEE